MSNIETVNSTECLPRAALDMHRAIISLIEELQAIDSYDQRAYLTKDSELNGIFVHNRNEEIEHASMLLEWIQRNDPNFSLALKKQLFTTNKIAQH
jgi:hypothetical protein